MTDSTNMLPRLAAESMANRAYAALRAEVLDGRFKPSERIVIDRVSREMGVSLGPIREALARLASERLVVLETNKGYRVAPSLTHRDIAMWQEARLILECESARLAAKFAKPVHVKRLRAINENIRKREYGPGSKNVLAYMALNNAFHELIISLTGNEVLERMYEAMHYGPQVTREQAEQGVTDRMQIYEEHEKIVHALEVRSGDEAALAMRRHIIDAMERARERASLNDMPGRGQ